MILFDTILFFQNFAAHTHAKLSQILLISKIRAARCLNKSVVFSAQVQITIYTYAAILKWCQPFRFWNTFFYLQSLKKPIIPVVVGEGSGWQETVIGLLVSSQETEIIDMQSVTTEESYRNALEKIE